MACKLHTINGKPNSFSLREYIVDTPDDIALLPRYGVKGTMKVDASDKVSNDPCAIGSTALVCQNADNTSEVWMLSPSNEWVKL